MTEKIVSIKDPRVVEARELQSREGRKKHNQFLLYGLEQIKWALAKNITILYIFSEKVLSTIPCTFLEVSDGILKKISDTNYIIPYIAVAKMPQKQVKKSDFLLVLDRIQDYGNLGTIIRTAQGFSVNTFVFSSQDADPFQKKVIDSSRGLVFSSNFHYKDNSENTIDWLKKNNYQLIATSPHAKHLLSQVFLKSDKPLALIVGNETEGADELFLNAADIVIQIPMNKEIESFNVAIATGISMYELKFRQTLLMLKEKIFTNFGREINLLGMYIRTVFDQEISKVTSLNGKQIILLMIMHCDQLMSKKQISRDVSLFDKELDTFLEPLLEKRLIISEDDNYKVSSEGERFLAELWPIIEQIQQKLFSQFHEEEIHTLLYLMEKLKTSCLEIIDNTSGR